MNIPEKLQPLIEGSFVKVYGECQFCHGRRKLTITDIKKFCDLSFVCATCQGKGVQEYRLTPQEFHQLAILQAAHEQEKKSKK